MPIPVSIKDEGLDGAAFLFLLSLSLTVPGSGAEYKGTLNFLSGITGVEALGVGLITEFASEGSVDGSKLSHSTLSDGKKNAALLEADMEEDVGVCAADEEDCGQSLFTDVGGEVSLEPPIKDDLDSQRSVSSLIVFDPGDILVMEERLEEGC